MNDADHSWFIILSLKLSLPYQFGCVIGFCLVSQNLPRVWSSAKKLCLEFENIVSEHPPRLQLTDWSCVSSRKYNLLSDDDKMILVKDPRRWSWKDKEEGRRQQRGWFHAWTSAAALPWHPPVASTSTDLQNIVALPPASTLAPASPLSPIYAR